MSENNNTVKKMVTVTLAVCLVCSIVVSSAAVLLRPAQIANQQLDIRRNLLAAAGLMEPGRSVQEIFEERIAVRVVDLETGQFTDAVDPETYDQVRASRDAGMSRRLSSDEDKAGLSRRERYSVVYLVEENGELETIILPVRGFGLWSTMHGFLALAADGRTVQGLGFYEHGETPGLGGEIDNPNWQAQWEGRKVYDDQGDVAIRVVKGRADPDAVHQVDGLSGATLTARGVHNMMHFWLGDNGFRPFLANLLENHLSQDDNPLEGEI